jgi:hypothetical protein
MSSWLSSFQDATNALKEIGGELGELTSQVTSQVGGELGTLSNKVQSKVQVVQSKVQEALPEGPDNLFSKLTLQSDELVREHELLDAQEKRKELVREYLSEILPWETKDEASLILVDHCKEAILNLSKEKSTFETPFELQRGIMFNPTASFEDDSDDENENENEGEEEVDEDVVHFDAKEDVEEVDKDEPKQEREDEKVEEQVKEVESKDTQIDGAAAVIKASAAKLEKMQPLPLLLEHFDIDTHVGLIERVLKIDEELVYMHSNLSGAGEKETIFWKNYFFHCAYTRYEKGLSVDEIWSSKPKASITGMSSMSNHTDMSTTVVDAAEPSLHDMIHEESSVELEFHEDDSNFDDTTTPSSSSTLNQSSQSTPAPSISTPSVDIGSGGTAEEASNVTQPVSSYEHHSDSGGSGTSYEIVDGGNNNDDDDYLDDLEAEIARELGEL